MWEKSVFISQVNIYLYFKNVICDACEKIKHFRPWYVLFFVHILSSINLPTADWLKFYAVCLMVHIKDSIQLIRNPQNVLVVMHVM